MLFLSQHLRHHPTQWAQNRGCYCLSLSSQWSPSHTVGLEHEAKNRQAETMLKFPSHPVGLEHRDIENATYLEVWESPSHAVGLEPLLFRETSITKLKSPSHPVGSELRCSCNDVMACWGRHPTQWARNRFFSDTNANHTFEVAIPPSGLGT